MWYRWNTTARWSTWFMQKNIAVSYITRCTSQWCVHLVVQGQRQERGFLDIGQIPHLSQNY